MGVHLKLTTLVGPDSHFKTYLLGGNDKAYPSEGEVWGCLAEWHGKSKWRLGREDAGNFG